MIVKKEWKILCKVITISKTAASKLPHMAQMLNNRKHVTPVKYLSGTEKQVQIIKLTTTKETINCTN